MPIRYEKDRNGQWKAIGVASRDELQPRELKAGSPEANRAAGFGRPVGARATLRGRPVVWAGPDLGWQSAGSFEKAKRQGRLPKPPSQPVNNRKGLSWLQNELAWLGNGIRGNVQDTMKRGLSPAHLSFGPVLGPIIGTVAGRQNVAAYQVGTWNNVMKSGEALVQSLQGKEVNPGQAGWIRDLTETGYRALGAKPPSQMTRQEMDVDSGIRSLGINVAVSGAMAPLAPMGVGATALGSLVRGGGLFVGEQVIATALDDNTPGNASSLAEAALGAMGIQVQVPGSIQPTDDWGEATRKSLIPNTVAAGLVGAGLGVAGKSLGFTKRWLKERRVTSEQQQARAWAEERGLITQGDQGFVNRYSPPEFVGDISLNRQPQSPAMPGPGPGMDVSGEMPAAPAPGMQLNRPTAGAPAVGSALEIEGVDRAAGTGDVSLAGPDPSLAPPPPAPAPAPAAERTVIGRPDSYSPVQSRLQEMEAAQNPDTAAYQQWLEQNQRIRGVPSQEMQMGGPVLDGELPRWEVEAGDPWVDPADFDPAANAAAPETDQFIRDIWNLDDTSLIAAAEEQGSAVESVRRQLATQQAFDPAEDPRFSESAVQLSTAPGESLGFQGPEGLSAYEAGLRAEDSSGLRALTDPDNNPRVARIIQGNTGREPSEFTREDMIEGLLEQAQSDNRFVIPRPNGELNRPGEVVWPVDDLGVDPSRFQFKGGIDPTTGEQFGQSLEGVDAWNTDLEGTVSAWRDPVDDSAWVINGHNRVAAARRLGVNSLPVKFYEAPNAAAARAIGAAQNIATGQGTPIDAAKFMRDTGVTDVAQLKSLVPGMPMKSGWAEQGLALSRLPDDAFAAVVSGDLTTARGALIGASGRTPEEMSALWRYAEKRNVSDRVLRELVSMTAPTATATPDIARQKTIWEVLGSDSPEAQAFNTGMLNKAKLVDRVRSLLAADRKLFAAVAARGAAERLQAGAANSIDTVGSRAVADQASQVLGIFDQLRYQTGPIGDLLNQGVLRLDGEKLDAVARDVSGQVADAMEKTLGIGGPAGEIVANAPRAVALPSAEDIAWAEANLLTPRKLKTRLAKKAEYDAQWERVSDVVQNPEKYAELPEAEMPRAPLKAADNRLQRELQNHERAQRILDEVAAAEQRGTVAADAMASLADTPADPPAPVRLTPEQRDQLQVGLVQRAIDGDEVRPPSTPEPELFEAPQVPLARALEAFDNEGVVLGNDAAQAMADELRLAAEYSYRDAAIEKASREAMRQENGYYELDLSERMASGQFRDGFRDEPAVGTGLDERAAYARQQRQQAEAAGDAERAAAWREEERQLERSRVGNAMQAGGQNQQDLFGVGEYDTTAPLLNQQAEPQPGSGPMASPQLLEDLNDSTKGASLERLLLSDIPPAERELILKQFGNERLEGVWTLGQEGAANRLEQDILKFVKRMTGGANVDIADAVLVRTNGAGYGRGGTPIPQQVGGVNADHIYSEEGAVLLISRFDEMLGERGVAEIAETGAHEAVHFLQSRRLTQKQLEALASDEATAYFRSEAGKARKWGSADELANIELMAWGSQRVIAARLLRDMAAAYRKQGLKKTAAHVDKIRAARLGEYLAPPKGVEAALEPLIDLWERVKNYLLGAGFKRNADLSTQQLQVIARFTDEIAELGHSRIAKAIDSRSRSAPQPPDEVRKLLDAAYTGQIGKQMYLRPGRMGDRALANYERRWDVLGVSPNDYEAMGLPRPPARPLAPLPPERPKPLKASPWGLVPEGVAPRLSPFGPLDLVNNPAAIGPSELVLPEAVQRNAPAFRNAEVRFVSPLDQAAYVLASENATAPSRATNQLRKMLEAAGYDPADVARYGRENIAPAIKAASGEGGSSRQAGALIELPDQGYQGSTRLPRQEVQRLKAQMASLNKELATLDAELDQITKQAALGGCN